MITAYHVCLILAVLCGIWIFRRERTSRQTDRLIVASIPVLFVLVATCFVQPLLDAPYRSVWNPVRLTPTFGLCAGHPLYHVATDGPVSGHIYGPLAALAYVPVVLATTATQALYLGTLLSLIIYFAPVVWLAFAARNSSSDRGTVLAGLVALALFPILTFVRPQSLGYVASLVHADGPAVALGGAAAAVLYVHHENRWWSLMLSAVFAVLAVWSKQVMAPLLLGLPFWLWWSAGTRTAVHYLACVTAAGFGATAVFVAMNDVHAMCFNLVVIPSRHPADITKWGPFPGSLLHVVFEWLTFGWVMLLVLVVGYVIDITRHGAAQLGKQQWTVFLVGAIVLLPTSLLGRLKVGGSENALSFTLYFLLLAMCLMLYERAIAGYRWLVIAPVLGCAIFLFRAQQERFALLAAPQVNVNEMVHDYLRAHPGEAYFPWNPLGHFMAEGRVYHFDYGVFDRELAGFPLESEHIRRHMPANPRLICFDPKANMRYIMKYLPEYSRRVNVPELPGFDCFEREQPLP